MFIFSANDIYKNLPYQDCIEIMQQCFEDLGDGLIGMEPKHAAHLPDNKSILGVMSAYQTKGTFAIIKSIGLFPNIKNINNSHQGVISLFDIKKGKLLAIFDAGSITALRTASVSALATKYLSHPKANTLSLIGAGEQSFHQAIAISKVRDIKKLNIFNRTIENAQKLKLDLMDYGFSIPIDSYPIESIQKISKDFDIISIATSSPRPILKLHDLPKLCHINSIGACTPNVSELDSDIVNISDLIVDDYEVSKLEAGNLINSKNKSFLKNINELKDIIIKDAFKSNGITIFNSTGLGAQDLYCAINLYQKNQDKACAKIQLEGLHAK